MHYFINVLILAFLPMALKIKRKRIALMWMGLIYVLIALTAAILPPFLEMQNFGEADSQLLAGHISERLVASVLEGVVIIPSAFLIFWIIRAKAK